MNHIGSCKITPRVFKDLKNFEAIFKFFWNGVQMFL